MKPLSEQLIELSARAKKTEELVSAAQAKNQAALQSQREELQFVNQYVQGAGSGADRRADPRGAVLVGRDAHRGQ